MDFEISDEARMWEQTLNFKQCVGLASDVSRKSKEDIIKTIDSGIRMLSANDYIAWQNMMNIAKRKWQNL